MNDRARVRRALETTEFDLAIVGGGITGAGVARDAALRGLKVVLLEKGDLARGTSSASSKLIHGGLRYLEQLELGLVREGVRERALLMRNAPHLARPLPFIFPIYEKSRAGPFKVMCGMWLYDALAHFQNFRNHIMLRRRQVERREPALRRQGLRAGTLYYDCHTDDGRLVVETAVDAAARGAVIGSYHEVTAFQRDSLGHVTGVRVKDSLPGGSGEVTVRARITLSATGPWTDQLLGGVAAKPRTYLRPTKGIHIVLPRERLPLTNAIVLTTVRDERVVFAIPWGERSYVGTTDTDDPSSPDECRANAWDVAYLLETANHFFPGLRARPEDVISTWAGLRPLMAADPSRPSDVSREHEILDVVPGLMAIAGGKLTTYRLMAEQAVDRVLLKLGVRGGQFRDRCVTETTPLPGASDPSKLADLEACGRALAKRSGLPFDMALHLIHSYGLRADLVLEAGRDAGVAPERMVEGLPYNWAEVVFATRSEFAARVDDVLRRRTLVTLKALDQGLGVCERTAEVMGQVLGWNKERVQDEVARYRQIVAESRSYLSESLPHPTPPPQAGEGVSATKFSDSTGVQRS
jgi:glycerol-3-phosphate dehydrogenase